MSKLKFGRDGLTEEVISEFARMVREFKKVTKKDLARSVYKTYKERGPVRGYPTRTLGSILDEVRRVCVRNSERARQMERDYKISPRHDRQWVWAVPVEEQLEEVDIIWGDESPQRNGERTVKNKPEEKFNPLTELIRTVKFHLQKVRDRISDEEALFHLGRIYNLIDEIENHLG